MAQRTALTQATSAEEKRKEKQKQSLQLIAESLQIARETTSELSQQAGIRDLPS